MSSSDDDAAVLRHIGMPTSAAARATARSASACRIDSTPTGLSITGARISVPSTVVARLRVLTSPSIRGTSAWRSKASRLARIVRPSPAPPAT